MRILGSNSVTPGGSGDYFIAFSRVEVYLGVICTVLDTST